MKNIIPCLLMLVVTMGCTQAQTEFSKTALNETLLNSEGSQTSFKEILKKHKGKTLVIECWASWCSDCVKAMPKVKELQAQHPEVDYVFVSMDKTSEKWKLGIEKHDLQGEHYLTNDGMKGVFGTAINLDWIPRYIVVDKHGKIALYRAIETDFDLIDKTLNSLK